MIFLGILACLLLAAFFAGMETGLLSADQLLIYSEREKGVGYARSASYLVEKPERLLATTLIGTNISVVTAAILLNSYLRPRLGSLESGLGSLGLTILLLIFSEIVPKTFFRQQANNVALHLAPLLLFFHYLFLPLSVLLNGLIGLFLAVIGQSRPHGKLPQSREDLQLLVRLGSRESGLQVSETRIFDDIFDFRNTMAREVMIPLHQHPVCWLDQSPGTLVQVSLRTGARFLPICMDRTDNVIGYVDIEELSTRRVESVREIMREPVFYPDIKKIPELLLEMNQQKVEMVFLADEYGAISGLITPREIAAEIVGVIPGKQLLAEQRIRRTAPGVYEVPGTASLDELYHETAIRVSRGPYDTVGGFLCDRMGEIPQIGATFEEAGICFRVLERDARHVRSIEVRKKESQ